MDVCCELGGDHYTDEVCSADISGPGMDECESYEW
jgi:hypothetical protein